MFTNSGTTRFGSAEKALLSLALIVAAITPFFPVTAHGVVNWYVTGFDDLLIYSSTHLDARRKRKTAFAVAGLLVAVALMVALVALAGNKLSAFAEYAKWSAVVPLWYAAKGAYKIWKGEEDENEEETWWMKYRVFGRAFFGFAANCLDDIALNTSMLAGAYAGHSVEYLSGIAIGAVTMVALAATLGNKIRDYPILYVLGYLLAASVILFL